MEDLRLLDPSDTPDPATDITAVYLRQTQHTLQLRIDLLDIEFDSPYELLVYLWDDSNFADTPLEILISWDGSAEVLTVGEPAEKILPRIARDFEIDTIVLSIRLAEIGSNPRLDIISSLPDGTQTADEAHTLTLEASPPDGYTKLAMVFYDAFQGTTPALALRSWDGAHTGPRGERHGLRYLVEAVESYQFPLVLLDLQTPQNLSALDALGATETLERLSNQHIIGYPQFSLAPVIFLPAEINPEFEPTPEGPTYFLRSALINAALTKNPSPLVLGGRLSQSTWASPDYVYPTLAYIAARPYILPMSIKEISQYYEQELTHELSWPSLSQPPVEMVIAETDSLLSLPTEIPQQVELQNIYRDNLLPPLEKAAIWAEAPASLLECTDDTCLWADAHFFAVFKLNGARLEFLFYHHRKGIHQVIGPTAQFTTAMSDPSLWNKSLGEGADPGQIMGAFFDTDEPYALYEPRSAENGLAFVRTDGQRVKVFNFEQDTLTVTYQGTSTSTQIPLVIDPWQRFQPGWASEYQLDGTRWGLEKGLMVIIQAENPIMVNGFNETLGLMNQPEDPDQEYPAGHFMPFPMAIAELIQPGGDNVIRLILEVVE